MDTLALQGMMVAKLEASSELADVPCAVYDHISPDAVFPYVVVGQVQASNVSTVDCVEDWEVFAQVDVWSRTVGYPEAKRIAALCDAALGQRHPIMIGFRMGFFEAWTQRFLTDPDGITRHGVLEYRSRYGPAP